MKFTKQIFLGNGIQSMAESYAIHNLVEETLESISAIQQEGLQGYEPNKDSIDDAQHVINQNVKQIVMALTGKKLPKKFFEK